MWDAHLLREERQVLDPGVDLAVVAARLPAHLAASRLRAEGSGNTIRWPRATRPDRFALLLAALTDLEAGMSGGAQLAEGVLLKPGLCVQRGEVRKSGRFDSTDFGLCGWCEIQPGTDLTFVRAHLTMDSGGGAATNVLVELDATRDEEEAIERLEAMWGDAHPSARSFGGHGLVVILGAPTAQLELGIAAVCGVSGMSLHVERQPLLAKDRVCAELRSRRPRAVLLLDRAAGGAADEGRFRASCAEAEVVERIDTSQPPNEIAAHVRLVCAASRGVLKERALGNGQPIRELPESWQEVATRIDELMSEAFIFTEQVRNGLSACGYAYPDRMWSFLDTLAQCAGLFRANNAELGQSFVQWAHENFALTVALHDGRLGEWTDFEYDGHRYSREPHVKIDDGKPFNEVGRIYFAIDGSNKRLIVGHVGLKPYR
jgi:hypothetical protein